MKPVAIATVAILLSACSTQTRTHSALAPLDPQATRTIRAQTSVLSGTVNPQPVEPRPWTTSNNNVSPEAE